MSSFARHEYLERVAATRRELDKRGLDALLVFAQESHYYLFGYDGGGYVFFQCAILPTDGRDPILLCRRPDVAQALDCELLEDARVWLNANDQDPAGDLKDILRELNLQNASIGIETNTYGLTGFNYRLVADALQGFCALEEASDVVSTLRLVKSPAEQEMVRRASQLADDAISAVAQKAAPGILDSQLTAAAVEAILLGGGDMPPAGPLVNSGRRAQYGRGVGGPRELSATDQVVVELAATYRRYNCCIERSITVGDRRPEYEALYRIVQDAFHAMLDAFRPGEPVGIVDQVHREMLDRAGYRESRYAACGYSLGATFRPSWMDVPPMIYAGNPLIMAPGMVFFPHVMLADKRTQCAVGLGNTVLVTDDSAESLTRHNLDPIR